MPRTGTNRFRFNTRVKIKHTNKPLSSKRNLIYKILISRLNKQTSRLPNEPWSGEATRNQGFAVEEARVDVTIGGSDIPDAVKQKDRPVWMTESTVITNDTATMESADSILEKAAAQSSTQTSSGTNSTSTARSRRENEDIMSVLLQHEKQQANRSNAAVKGLGGNSSDSSDDENMNDIDNTEIRESLSASPFRIILFNNRNQIIFFSRH